METKSTYVNTARQIHLLSLDIKASCKRQAKKKKKNHKNLISSGNKQNVDQTEASL